MPSGESWRRVPPEQRARQFMPFAALRGYYELVDEAAEPAQPRRELSEESLLELGERLSHVEKGTLVRVEHHDGTRYVSTCGIVTDIDRTFRTITIVKRRIALDDVSAIELVQER